MIKLLVLRTGEEIDGLALWCGGNDVDTPDIDAAEFVTPEQALAMQRNGSNVFPIPRDLAEAHHGWIEHAGKRIRAVTASDASVLRDTVRRQQDAARMNNAVKTRFAHAFESHVLGCPVCLVRGQDSCEIGRILFRCAERGLNAT